jgi:hypothetical protein
METVNIILDLDGVLITTPPWKSDEFLEDDYSKFNENCVENLNSVLNLFPCKIWLSSTRRLVKTKDEFNSIFSKRKIINPITDFLPDRPDLKTRREEVLNFLDQKQFKNFIIIDDDKSLNSLDFEIKEHLILTTLLQGFNTEKLEEAIEKLNITPK